MSFHDLKAALRKIEVEIRVLYDVGFFSFDDQFIFPQCGKDGGILSTAGTLVLVLHPNFVPGASPIKGTFSLLIPNPFHCEEVSRTCELVRRAAEILRELEWVKQGEQDPNQQPRFTSMDGGLLGDPIPLAEVEKRYGGVMVL